jgi:hypothetical protein
VDNLYLVRRCSLFAVMETFFYPTNWFIKWPYLALLPAFLFGFCYFVLRSRSAPIGRRIALSAATSWLLYAVYEWRMFLWSKTVSGPIRVDLLLIAPLLYLVTIAGIGATIVGLRRTSATYSE